MSSQGQKKDRSRVNAVESDDEYVFTVSLSTPTIDDASIDVQIEGVTVNMLIDPGASHNIVSLSTWHDLKRDGVTAQLGQTNKKLYSYGAEKPLQCLGIFKAPIQANNQKVKADFIVVDGQDRGLLGRKTAQ